jgi:hypothetical protein
MFSPIDGSNVQWDREVALPLHELYLYGPIATDHLL